MDPRSTTKLGALAALFALAAPDELSYGKLKSELGETLRRDPMDATLTVVVVASYLFFKAEKGHNPKVETFADALVFISTCLSVGYSDIFARTTNGKLIATAVMTLGPAMTQKLFDAAQPVSAHDAEVLATQRTIASHLEAILRESRARAEER